MNGLAGVPAVYWQILGALCGLALGIWLGAMHQHWRRRSDPSSDQPPKPDSATLSSAPSSARGRVAASVSSSAERSGSKASVRSKSTATGHPAAPVRRGSASPAPRERETAPVTVSAALEPSETMLALQSNNTELLAQLKAMQSAQNQEAQERHTLLQMERRRHENLLESVRQEHSAELSQLMGTMVEQVDSLHQSYGARIKALEEEIERLRVGGGAEAS